MIQDSQQVRVRYAETDQMGYVYYGNYAVYYEIARAELVRKIGIPYGEMERQQQILLPVVELHVKYRNPALYDELLTIRTQVRERPTARIRFDHQIFNPRDELVVEGHAALAFFNARTQRPERAPSNLLECVDAYWGHDLSQDEPQPATES